MKVSVAQMDIIQGDKEKNLEKGISFIEEAAANGSGLIVLPELWTTGYVKNLHELSEPCDGETIERLAASAKKYDIAITGTLAERADAYYNTMHYISPNGLHASYRKMHLFSPMHEERLFSPGTEKCVYENIGMLICYDLRFPELSRELVLKCAEILIVAAEWPYPRLDHWRTLLRARAIENLAYVIACNRTGKDKNFEYVGHSALIDPWGRTIIEGGTEESLLTGAIDISKVREARKMIPTLRDVKERY